MKAPRGAGAYQARFAWLRDRREGAFVPFLMLGDPDPGTSLELARALIAAGADALELGLPFSDPIADGPVIQAAAGRARAAGTTPRLALDLASRIRAEHSDLPVGLLVYANLVLHRDPAEFYQAAAAAGVDSVLVADAPLGEAGRFATAARTAGIAPVLIAPPNAADETLRAIAATSEGYVYVVSRPGVTGADDRLRADSTRVVRSLADLGAAPALLGFGISAPDQVRAALAMGAAGAISGSAVVRHIAEAAGDRIALLERITGFAAAMKAATRLSDAAVEGRY